MTAPAVDSLAARKSRGAYFTPSNIVKYMVDWAVRSPDDVILEPSCGEAEFLIQATGRLKELGAPSFITGAEQLVGYDIHEDSVARARKDLSAVGARADIEVDNFLSREPDRRFDAVVGNPPYVRYQAFVGEDRAFAKRAADEAGVAVTDLASSWASFVVHSARFCRDGGRLALVLPGELLSVNYARGVREFLLNSFRSIRLVTFTERVFPGVIAEVVLLLGEGYALGPADGYELVQARSASVGDLERARSSTWTPQAASDKWTASFLDSAVSDLYNHIISGQSFTTLQEWGDTTLGIVTGNNKYFTMSPGQAAELGLTDDDLLPISPPGSKHLRNVSLDDSRLKLLAAEGARTRLFRPRDAPSAAAEKFIEGGESSGVPEAYKCRVRKPWWRVPIVPPSDILLTYMNSDAVRFCRNTAGVFNLNSVHGFYLKPSYRELGKATIPIASLNSFTLLSAELNGRSYGGGLLKIEPKEADRLAIPTASALRAAASDIATLEPMVMTLLSERAGLSQAIKLVDHVLLHDWLGISGHEISLLQAGREALMQRRLARGKAAKKDTN